MLFRSLVHSSVLQIAFPCSLLWWLSGTRFCQESLCGIPRSVIFASIAEAAQYVPLDRLCLSTQCGFASTEEGNKLTEEQQWAKIALVQSVAKDVWGE